MHSVRCRPCLPDARFKRPDTLVVSPHATGAELDTLLQAALPVETTTVMPIGVNVQMHPFTGCTDHTHSQAVRITPCCWQSLWPEARLWSLSCIPAYAAMDGTPCMARMASR